MINGVGIRATDPYALTTAEREDFWRLFGQDLTANDYALLIDGFPLTADHPLRAEHEYASRVMLDILARFDVALETSEARLHALLRADVLFQTEVGARDRHEVGRLFAALVERALWISHNAHRSRLSEAWRFYSLAPALGRLVAGHSCVLPEDHLAMLLTRASSPDFTPVRAPIGNIAHLLPEVLRSIPCGRTFAEAFGAQLRAAFVAVADRLDALAQPMFGFEGGRKAMLDGMTLERLCAALKGEAVPPILGKGTKPIVDLDRIPARPGKVPKPRTSPKTKARANAARLVPLDANASLARAVFGDAATDRLDFRELSFDGIQLLESKELTSLSAAKALAAAEEKRGVHLALVANSLSSAKPTAALIRQALDAQHDDDAYRRWLRGALDARRSEVEAMRATLEAEARDLAAATKLKSRPSKTPPRVRLVALAGASTAVLPTLYGLGGYNDCPDPVVHAAVLGRWAREFGASVRILSREALTLDLARPARKPADVAWAAIANFLYCPESANPIEAAKYVTGPRWSFWWD